MKVHYFFRQFHQHQTSIEKLFNIIIPAVEKNNVVTKHVENKYDFTLKGILSTLFFFHKNQGEINHITGDIHWAILGVKRDRTILTIHDLVGMVQLRGLKKKIYYLFWIYFPIKKAKYITVISPKSKDEILKYFPDAADKITVIPNCLTIEAAPLILNKNNPVSRILIIGTRHNKNIDRIFKSLIGITCELEIVGELSDEQKKFLHENRFTFQNVSKVSEEELLQVYDRSDILCFPSLYEGFGLPILEAQARNCAVITSNISPMKEVAGEAAELVDPESVEEIRNAVLMLINDREKRAELITRGHENIKKYSKEKIAEQYIEIYRKIAKV